MSEPHDHGARDDCDRGCPAYEEPVLPKFLAWAGKRDRGEPASPAEELEALLEVEDSFGELRRGVVGRARARIDALNAAGNRAPLSSTTTDSVVGPLVTEIHTEGYNGGWYRKGEIESRLLAMPDTEFDAYVAACRQARELAARVVHAHAEAEARRKKEELFEALKKELGK